MSLEDFRRLETRAARPWRRVRDDDTSPIVISPEQFLAFLANVVSLSASKSIRGPLERGNVRALVRMRPPGLVTNKTEADRTWGRFAKLEQSNQRSWQESQVIDEVRAVGKVSLPADMQLRDLRCTIEWGLDRVGIGAARPMGFGRGKLISLE